MGLKSIKRKINRKIKESKTPPGMIYYHGSYVHRYINEDSLPDNLKDLLKMARYYSDRATEERDKDTVLKKVVLKANELVQTGKEVDPGWVNATVIDLFGTNSQKIEYAYQCFIKDVRKCLITQSDKDKRDRLGKYEWYSLVEDHDILNTRLVRNNFKYREDCYDAKKKAFDNEKVMYFENQMFDIINVIMELVNKEKTGQYISYVGYYMYKDLYRYFSEYEKTNKHFDFTIWQDANEYLELLYKNYDLVELATKERKARFNEMQKEAMKEVSNLTRGKLLNGYNTWDEIMQKNGIIQERKQDEFESYFDDKAYSLEDEDEIIEMMESIEKEAARREKRKQETQVDEKTKKARIKAKNCIWLFDSRPYIKGDIQKYRVYFDEAKDGELWYELASKIENYIADADIKQEYEICLKEAAELGNFDAYLDLVNRFGYEKYGYLQEQFKDDETYVDYDLV